MPLISKNVNKYGIVGIWKMEEQAGDLLKICCLSESEKEKIGNISSEKRKVEFLAGRILLQTICPGNAEIAYEKSGKPLLRDSSVKISISHSADFAAVFISEYEIGVDIERVNRKIDSVATRFLHPDEMGFIEKLHNRQFAKILFWSAKEAIFKGGGEQNILFNKMILINPFDIENDNEFEGRLLLPGAGEKNFLLNYSIIENNVMVYAVLQ